MKGNERTVYASSPNESTNVVSSSTALSIFSAYSPMIQMSDAFASGSSSSSRLAHSVGMTPSYVEGYLRKISCRPHNTSGLLSERKVEGTDFHDHDRLLNYIANSRIDQFHEHVDATFRRRLNLDRTLPDRLDALPHEINIDFRGVPSSSHQSSIITYY